MDNIANRPRLSIACIVIASAHRRELLDDLIMPSVIGQGFSEAVVVGDYHSGNGYRHLPVPDITATTVDAQIKRDVATMATQSEWLVYLSDDHRLDPFFHLALEEANLNITRIGVPRRFCVRGDDELDLNMGDGYCGGHAGVFHRTAIREVPFSVAPHHPNWDVLHSQMLLSRGYSLAQLPDCLIEDIEPGGAPWI